MSSSFIYEKICKKVEKICKKVLTFKLQYGKIYLGASNSPTPHRY